MIKKLDDGAFVISADQTWRPGVFATEKAARMGQRLLDEEIMALQNKVNATEQDASKRVITEEMIRDAPRWPKAPVECCWACNEKLWGGGRYFEIVEIDSEKKYLHTPCAEKKAAAK